MVNSIDRAVGIVERTSADIADGPWTPGLQMTRGWLWAATIDGTPVAAFETAPGRVLFGFDATTVTGVVKRSSGLNMVVDVSYRLVSDEETVTGVVTLVAPRGRLKRILTHIGQRV